MPFVIMKQESFATSARRLVKRRFSQIDYVNTKALAKFIVLITFFTTLGILSRHGNTLPKRKVTEPVLPSTKNIRITKWTRPTDEEAKLAVSRSNRRIFFHETSGRSQLTFRQCCAIESAAKNNPTRPVELYLSVDQFDVDKIKGCITVLDNYPNVEIFLLDNEEYFEGTLLENWYSKGEWRSSEFKVAHLSDFIRLLSLLRGGGFYLDIDYIILRELPEKKFTNFLVIEGLDGGLLNNGVMHFHANHWLVEKLIRFIDENYDPGDYYLHGPRALSNTFYDFCKYEDKEARKKACPDIKLISYKHFCPIGSPFWGLIFEDVTDFTLSLVRSSYGIHLWNSLSFKRQVNLGTRQLYALVAERNCPHCVQNDKAFVDRQ